MPGVGLLAACVPGAFGSWMLVLERFGTKSLREVLEPALCYAESGFPVLASLAATLTASSADMRAQWPTSASIWLGAGGGVPPAGGRLRNPQLASTLRRLLAEGEACGARIGRPRSRALGRAYYEGFVAEAIDGWCTTAGSGGLLRGADLAGWRASLEEPARLGFRRVRSLQDRAMGPGAGVPAAARRSWPGSIWLPWGRAVPTSSTS